MESHSAPPGYNPNVSLLQGGNAPILPVQGGGGVGVPPTANYDPNVSLLEGGTGTIHAMRGGDPDKKVSFASEKKLTKTELIPSRKENRKAATKFYVVEQYKIEPSDEELSKTNITKEQRRELYNNVFRNYQYERAKPYKIGKDGKVVDLPPSISRSFTSCKPRRPTFFESLPRLVRISTARDPILWIAVDIEGDVEKFTTVKDLFTKENTSGRGEMFLIFLGRFFSKSPAKNLTLADEFMKLKEKFPLQVYGIFYHETELLNTLCDIFTSLYGEKTRPTVTNPVHLLYEPDILVFPYRKLFIRNSPLPKDDDDFGLHSYLTDKTQVTKPPTFFLEQGKSEKQEIYIPSYFDISYLDFNISKRTVFPEKTDIQCEDPKKCPEFEGAYSLGNFGGHLNLRGNSGLFLVYNNESVKKLPFFHGEKNNNTTVTTAEEKKTEETKTEETKTEETKTEETKTEETKTEETKTEETVPPPPGPPSPPVAPSPQAELIEEKKEKEGAFKADPSAYKAKDNEEVQIDYTDFAVRVPTSINQVKEDWLKGVYTQGEVDLLNGLKMTPELLGKVFEDKKGTIWKEEIAAFFESLVVSKCFKDAKYLLASECDRSRRLLRKVYQYIYIDTLNNLYERWGIAAPESESADLIKALQNELAISIRMLGQNRKEMPVKTKDISINEFMGDPMGRYAKIHFNLEDPEQPFFLNYADLNENSEKRLKELEAEIKAIRKNLTYKRISGQNTKNVLKAFKNRTRKAKSTAKGNKGSTNEGTQTNTSKGNTGSTNEGTQTNTPQGNTGSSAVTTAAAASQAANVATQAAEAAVEAANTNKEKQNAEKAVNAAKEAVNAAKEAEKAVTTGGPNAEAKVAEAAAVAAVASINAGTAAAQVPNAAEAATATVAAANIAANAASNAVQLAKENANSSKEEKKINTVAQAVNNAKKEVEKAEVTIANNNIGNPFAGNTRNQPVNLKVKSAAEAKKEEIEKKKQELITAFIPPAARKFKRNTRSKSKNKNKSKSKTRKNY